MTTETLTLASSNLESVSYDDETSEMKITFQSGSEYLYTGVPRQVYRGFYTAPSAGKYFHRQVKGRFAYEQL